MKKVSVIIPAYNSAEWIAETIESVLAQDYQNFEVIVVDDGSNDETSFKVAQFPTVKYVLKDNGGTASARNKGISEATGEYIALVDSDDLWEPEKLSLQMALLERTGVEWVYSDAFAFDDKTGQRLFPFSKGVGKLYSGDILSQLFVKCFIPSPTPVVSRRVFETVGYFNESGDVFNREDWEMWLRIARLYPVEFVNRPLAHYRMHQRSKTGNNDPLKTLDEQLIVLDKLLRLEPNKLKPYKNKAEAFAYLSNARQLLSIGRSNDARPLLFKSCALNPYDYNSYKYLLLTYLPVAIRQTLKTFFRKFT